MDLAFVENNMNNAFCNSHILFVTFFFFYKTFVSNIDAQYHKTSKAPLQFQIIFIICVSIQ